MSIKLNKTFLKYAMFTWLGMIWFGTSLPGKSLPKLDTFNLDKFIHVGVYLVLAILIFKNYNIGLFHKLSRQHILLIAIALAALDESHQVFISNRYVSLYDLAANIAGLTVGYFLIKPEKECYD